MNRYTGEVLWQVTARYWFRHNGTCIGGDRLYTIDRLSGEQLVRRKQTVEDLDKPFMLRAFDLATGKEVWHTEDNVFGTWLSYSAKHDVLVEAGRYTRDTLRDEPKGMRAYHASDGKVLWYQKSYLGPAMIHGDEVLQDTGACDLLTGALKMRDDPITGEKVPWKWVRTYGCNTPAASENLLTFRSGAAGYFDLCNDGGTGNFGGFRSSCTNNLVVAGGIITAPEFTRTCTCSYQNQTSVALIHMPEMEMWTYFGTKDIKGSIKRLGVNFGAPGDRKADDGTLWLEYPSTGGLSPVVEVNVEPKNVELWRRYPGLFSGPYNWVASSGLKGVSTITIPLGKSRELRHYTVRLVFAEPEPIEPSRRRFHVDIQGDRKLADFEILRAAGGIRRSVLVEYRGVPVTDSLTVRLMPSGPDVLPPIISGLELAEEHP
jgi:hypothetical protein